MPVPFDGPVYFLFSVGRDFRPKRFRDESARGVPHAPLQRFIVISL